MISLDILPIDNWSIITEKPVIISGPCSAENRDQLVNTAIEIAKCKRVKILRAGIWKPRTRPNSFEGVGEIGLEWLKEAKEITGLLTTVEITTPEDIEACLKHGVDILWIGARSSSNPVYIKKLAEALKGIDIPLLVKNPVHPDIDLWIGTIERFNQIGIKRIAAIHRGFFPFEQTSLRNIPKWEIPIELKRRYPDLTIICDPSHIAGNTENIFEIAQKALLLDMDGLMIESHINPSVALSDKNQQLTPQALFSLLNNLTYSNEQSSNKEKISELELYREQLDSLDQQMIELLAERMKIIEKIGFYKSLNNLTIFQLRRWNKTLLINTKLGKKHGLSEEFIIKLISLIHMESIQRQNEIMEQHHKNQMT